MLLGELIKKFPLPTPPIPKTTPVAKTGTENGSLGDAKEIKQEPGQDKIKPPPEKKPRIS